MQGWTVDSGAGQDLQAHFLFIKNMSQVFEKFSDFNLALIDIPICMPDTGFRQCDILVRKCLGKRSSTIFIVPVRRVVFAKSYELACNVNYSVNGNQLSKQIWNITSKIKEVDLFFKKYPELIPRVRESHTEVCFQSLSELRGVRFSKKKVEGLGKESRY